MADIGSTPEMNRLAETLSNSMGNLREVGKQETGEVDAGSSTAVVSEAMAKFFEVARGLMSDVQHHADDVPKARATYERTDDAAAQGLPPLPLGNNTSKSGG